MRIPEEKIEEIRSAVNIVDLISGYVQLRKRGKNYVGLCPFHQEKTPSFTVSEEKQIYHCFGCHAGGNIFKFLMDFKSISFTEAVQEAAEYAGITLTYQKTGDAGYQNLQEEYYEINIKAAKYFSNNLLKESNGQIAREYFERRNIKIKTQKLFGLGYAKNKWDDFVNFCKSNKIDFEKAKLLGLIDSKANGEFYDKFRGRVIFPIFSPNGRVIAFGGRILENTDKAAKYLNSPESPIYSKRKSLYGLYHSKDEIRKLNKAILVEGYMDLISLFQNGIQNVVASSGTSLTEEQIRLLSRYTKNIVVLFDADEAGQKAAMRSIELLLKQDFDIKVLSLPEGYDPDSYVNKFGTGQFEEQIQRSQNFLEYQTAQFEAMGAFEDSSKYAGAIRELVKSASLVNDDLKRSLLLKSIAKKFNLREKLLESELEKFMRKSTRRSEKRTAYQVDSNGIRNVSANLATAKIDPMEKEIITLLFEGNEDIVGQIFDNISPDDLKNPKLKSLAKMVLKEFKEHNVSTAHLIEKIKDEESKDFILSLTLGEVAISSKWNKIASSNLVEKDLEKIASDTIKKFNIKKLDELIKQKNQKLTNSKNDQEIVELLQEIKELQKEKKQIINSNRVIT